ncbi:IclR family transcriptional regulator C-terminal domain-containing protein [Streptomyces sp. M19]
MSVNITIGTRFPAYATSMGRVLLAGLDADARAAHLAGLRPEPLTRRTVTSVPELARLVERAAEAGHALVDEELEEGLRSLAVPVRDAGGRVVAALNLATHAGRGPRTRCSPNCFPRCATPRPVSRRICGPPPRTAHRIDRPAGASARAALRALARP